MSIFLDQQQFLLIAVTVLIFIIFITGTEATNKNITATSPIVIG